MEHTPYTPSEIALRAYKTERKLLEAKESLKSIRDVSELRTEPKSADINTGQEIDRYI